MDRAKQRQIASKGGQSVPPEKRSFSQDPQLAAQAGRKGGESVPPEGRSFSQNRELAAEAGRKGGQARGAANRGEAAGGSQQGGKTAARRESKPLEGDGEMSADQSEDLDEGSDLLTGTQDIEQGDLAQTASPEGHRGTHPHGAR
jgi:general stress protein YciG